MTESREAGSRCEGQSCHHGGLDLLIFKGVFSTDELGVLVKVLQCPRNSAFSS